MPNVKKIKLEPLLERIIEDIDLVPKSWNYPVSELSSFSRTKTLYDYQVSALKNAIKGLYYFYTKGKSNTHFQQAFFTPSYLIELKQAFLESLLLHTSFEQRPLIKKLLQMEQGKGAFKELTKAFPVSTSSQKRKSKKPSSPYIEAHHFANRMGFWMATGSGKTLVLIKLLEIIDYFIQNGTIPLVNNKSRKNGYNFLILSHKPELLEQIKIHVREFNENRKRQIRLWSLRDFETVKTGQRLVDWDNEINVFYYRSDLLDLETKESKLSFRDVEDHGDWFIFLDEAHKGTTDDSKRQHYYAILSRYGFLFNFSATFVDPWDITTTVYNFNLARFITSGYGKNLLIPHKEFLTFTSKPNKASVHKDKTPDFSLLEKQRILLQILLIYTLVKRAKNRLDSRNQLSTPLYHDPLLVVYAKEVNTPSADLKLFFEYLTHIFTGTISMNSFVQAKEELKQLFASKEGRVFLYHEVYLDISLSSIDDIQFRDVLEAVFHSPLPSEAEVKRNPYNKKELALKLKSSAKPFALLKIGDVSEWLHTTLHDYRVDESFEDRNYFSQLNQIDSPITILMGSQAFYEGWDSNRPNLILFINLGVGDAKKFVIQAVGRGVRINPCKGFRKRLKHLITQGLHELKPIFYSYHESVSLLETLFIFGTNRDNLEKLLEGIHFIQQERTVTLKLQKNPKLKTLVSKQEPLLIPTYKKFPIQASPEHFKPKVPIPKPLLVQFVNWIGNDESTRLKRLYILLNSQSYHTKEISLQTIKQALSFLKTNHFNDKEPRSREHDPVSLFRELCNHVDLLFETHDSFKSLEQEIVHFEKIQLTLSQEKLAELQEKIKKVVQYSSINKTREDLLREFKDDKISNDEFDLQYHLIAEVESGVEFQSSENQKIEIKHVSQHFYVPILISEHDKISFMKHVIRVKSERVFLNHLISYLHEKNNLFNQFDWWFFSKLDEHLDSIYIPWYDPESRRVRAFKPDFIFWLKRNSPRGIPRYYIVFVDPKGHVHSQYQNKLASFKELFMIKNSGLKKYSFREFKYHGFIVSVHLYFYTRDKSIIPFLEERELFWIDSISAMLENLPP